MSDKYVAALQAALAPYEAKGEYPGVAFGGCPTGQQAICQAGKCAVTN